jgi:hypothetical protein
MVQTICTEDDEGGKQGGVPVETFNPPEIPPGGPFRA